MEKKKGHMVRFDTSIILRRGRWREPEIGYNFFDLGTNQHDFKVRRTSKLQKFKKTVADYYSLSDGNFILWLCKKDSRNKFRPRCIWKPEETEIGKIWDRHVQEFGDYPRLFVDVCEESANRLMSVPNTMMLFFKISLDGETSLIGSSYQMKDSTLALFEEKLLASNHYDIRATYEFFKEDEDAPDVIGVQVDRNAMLSVNFVDGDTVIVQAQRSSSVVCEHCYLTSETTLSPHDCNILINFDVAVFTKSLVPCERVDFFDFVDNEVHHFEIPRSTSVIDFQKQVAETVKTPWYRMLFWVCLGDGLRFRPSFVWEDDGKLPLGRLYDRMIEEGVDRPKIFLDFNREEAGDFHRFPQNTSETVLVFVKISTKELCLRLDRFYVPKSAVLLNLLGAMKRCRGDLNFSFDNGFEFFKEDYSVPNSKGDKLDPLLSFRVNKIVDGDTILCEMAGSIGGVAELVEKLSLQ